MVTIILMQNQDEVLFKVLWKEMYVSKLTMMLSLTFAGFICGLIIGRPKSKPENKDIPIEINNQQGNENIQPGKQLSEEDRDYIS